VGRGKEKTKTNTGKGEGRKRVWKIEKEKIVTPNYFTSCLTEVGRSLGWNSDRMEKRG